MIMGARFRKVALTAHVACAVGSLGAIAGFLALAVAGLISQNGPMVRAAYLAMELLKGTTLRARIKRGPLDLPLTLRIGIQIAAALDAAHRLGIVHRDLKPDNVYLTERAGDPDFVKLFDFGIARLRDRDEKRHEGPRTRSGVVMGTPEYMSPEQWRAVPDIDGRTDIYALGMLLHECLAGHVPFSGDLYSCLQLHMTAPLPPLPDLGPRTAALDALLRQMTAKEREERTPDARDVVAALQAMHTTSRPMRLSLSNAQTLVPGEFSLSQMRALAVSPPPRETENPVEMIPPRATQAERRQSKPATSRRVPPLLLAAGATAVVVTGAIALWPRSPAPPVPIRPAGAPAIAPLAPPPARLAPPPPVQSPPGAGSPAAPTPVPPLGESGEPAHPVRRPPPRTEVIGADPAQRTIILDCVQRGRLPASFEFTLRDVHWLGGTPVTQAFKDCIRYGFQNSKPPANATVRRGMGR